VQQCKTKIDSLKKRYRTELGKKTSIGSVNSSWVHYERLGPYLRKLPKVLGIPGAVDIGVEKVPSPPRRSSEEEEFEREGLRDSNGEAQDDDKQVNTEETPPQNPASVGQTTEVPTSSEGAQKRKAVLGAEDDGDDCKISSLPKFAGKAEVNGQLNSNGRGRKLFKASPTGTTAMSRSLDAYTKTQADFMAKAFEMEGKIEANHAHNALEIAKLKIEAQERAAQQKAEAQERAAQQ
jgi:hypothetical protein